MNKYLIDISMLIRANYYIVLKFVSEDQVNSQGLFNQIQKNLDSITLKLYQTYGFGDIIMCFDSTSFRKKIYEAYKANRLKTDKLGDLIHEVCEKIKVDYNYVRHEDLEADDIIYLLSLKYEKSKCIIVSNDADLYQVKCKMFSPTLKQPIDCQWQDDSINKKILEGCKTDNIPKLVDRLTSKLWKGIDYIVDKDVEFNYYNWLDKIPMLTDVTLEDYIRNYELTIFDLKVYEKYVKNCKNVFHL